jgi:hypothetical protein
MDLFCRFVCLFCEYYGSFNVIVFISLITDYGIVSFLFYESLCVYCVTASALSYVGQPESFM